MEPVVKRKLSLADYLQLEEEENMRYEYHSGEVFAMAGGAPRHGAIAANVTILLEGTFYPKGLVPRVARSTVT